MKQRQIIIVVTTEKQGDLMEAFSKMFRDKVQIKNAERQDRENIIQWLFDHEQRL